MALNSQSIESYDKGPTSEEIEREGAEQRSGKSCRIYLNQEATSQGSNDAGKPPRPLPTPASTSQAGVTAGTYFK